MDRESNGRARAFLRRVPVALVGAAFGAFFGHCAGERLGDAVTPQTGLFLMRGMNIFGYAMVGLGLGAIVGAVVALLITRRR